MKSVKAEYDASANVLRLVEPLEGVADHAEVNVTVEDPAVRAEEHPWADLRGSLPGEAGAELAALVEEMFPTEK